MRFSLLDLNLWNLNEPLTERMLSVCNFIKDRPPALIALQEVSYMEGEPQSSIIARAVGGTEAFAEAGGWQGRREGVALIAARGQLSDISSIPLEGRGIDSEPSRVLLSATWTLGGAKYLVATTHLAFRQSEVTQRYLQAVRMTEALAELLSASSYDAALVCADMNATPDEPAVRHLLRATCELGTWSSAGELCNSTEFTFAASNPLADRDLGTDRTIDYVFLVGDLTVGSYDVIFRGSNSNDPLVSDHYGLWLDLEARGE